MTAARVGSCILANARPWCRPLLALAAAAAFAAAGESGPGSGPPDVKPLSVTRAGEALAQPAEADYTRQYLSEVLADLAKRANLESAFAQPLNKSFNFSFSDKHASVKQVLEKLATAGGLDLELKVGTAIFWRKADDRLLDDCTAKLKADDRWTRAEAVWSLAQLADKRIYPLLFHAAADADPGVGYWALKGLLGHIRVLPYVDAANKDELVGALAKLTAQYSNDDNYIRDYIRMLGAVGTPLAFKTLAAYAKNSDPAVRVNAAVGLEFCKDPQAAGALQSLQKDPVVMSRKAAADQQTFFSFTKWDGRVMDPMLPSEMGNPRNPAIRDVMLEMIKDPASSADERKYAAGLLPYFMTDAKALDSILAVLQHADREVVLSALGLTLSGRMILGGERCYQEPRWLELLVPFAKDADPAVRAQAIALLGRIGNPWSTKALIQCLKDGGDQDKKCALNAVRGASQLPGNGRCRQADPLLLDAVAPFLTSTDTSLQKTAALALAGFGDGRGKDILFARLDEQLVEERRAPAYAQYEHMETLMALARLRDPRAIDPMLITLKQEPLRMGSVYGLVRLILDSGDARGKAALLEMVKDPNASTDARSHIGQELIASQDEALVKVGAAAMIEVLKDPKLFSPQQAILSLAKIKDPVLTDAVIAFLKDKAVDAAVRCRAGDCLCWWEMDEPTKEKFVGMLADHTIDGNVRASIATGLTGFGNTISQPRKPDARVLEFLIKVFNATEAGNSFHLVKGYALAYSGDPRALDALNEALKSPNAAMRSDAAMGLGSKKDPRALDALINLFNASAGEDCIQFHAILSNYNSLPVLSKADQARIKAALDEGAEKVKTAQTERMQRVMRELRKTPPATKPLPPPPSGDF